MLKLNIDNNACPAYLGIKQIILQIIITLGIVLSQYYQLNGMDSVLGT